MNSGELSEYGEEEYWCDSNEVWQRHEQDNKRQEQVEQLVRQGSR